MNDSELKGTELTVRQLNSIPAIISANTIEDGIKKARVGKTTFYKWLKNPKFKEELDKQRKAKFKDSLVQIQFITSKAVSVLIELLVSKNENMRYKSALALIKASQKMYEFEELEQRISDLENYLKRR